MRKILIKRMSSISVTREPFLNVDFDLLTEGRLSPPGSAGAAGHPLWPGVAMPLMSMSPGTADH